MTDMKDLEDEFDRVLDLNNLNEFDIDTILDFLAGFK